jgi:pyrimidine operon attenuation protein / uracil phosphoribosyltransferase
MVERGARDARTRDREFVPRSQLLSSQDVTRAVRRMAHEVVEHVKEIEKVVVIGLQTGGADFADRMTTDLEEITGANVQRGYLDVAFYRDDLARNPAPRPASTSIDCDLTDQTVVLVDDVLFTGRTVRAALNALTDWGRPRAVQLAVMVDRGHRELPIRPDYVGKNLPTSLDEAIVATLDGVWIGTRGVA